MKERYIIFVKEGFKITSPMTGEKCVKYLNKMSNMDFTWSPMYIYTVSEFIKSFEKSYNGICTFSKFWDSEMRKAYKYLKEVEGL